MGDCDQTPRPKLQNEVRTGSCDNHPRPESPDEARTGGCGKFSHPDTYKKLPMTSRSCLRVSPSSTKSGMNDRIALRLKQLDEERAIQQRILDVEERILAFERKAMQAKYEMLQKLLAKKSSVRSERTDNTPSINNNKPMMDVPAGTLERSLVQSGNQPIPKQLLQVDTPADQLYFYEIQPQNYSACLEANPKDSNMHTNHNIEPIKRNIRAGSLACKERKCITDYRRSHENILWLKQYAHSCTRWGIVGEMHQQRKWLLPHQLHSRK